MSEKVDNTKDTAINKARLAANIPLEFKTGQIIRKPEQGEWWAQWYR